MVHICDCTGHFLRNWARLWMCCTSFKKVLLTCHLVFECRDFFLSVIADRKHADSDAFRKFRRQLFHSSLSAILEPLKAGMTTPEIVRCPDGHYRRAVYGLGPYIADYPEQCLLGCIVQDWCPRYGYHN